MSKSYNSVLQFPVDDSSSEEGDLSESDDSEAETETFYDKSLKFYSDEHRSKNELNINMLSNGLELSANFVESYLLKDVKMYDKMLDVNESLKLCEKSPEKYKHCKIEILNPHKAMCTTLNNQLEIEISGRSRCGMVFNEDEVVVEILNIGKDFAKSHKNVDRKIYGKVISITKRSKSIPKHPVFVCTLDDHFLHHMIPHCKTVPKIYVLNKRHERSGTPEVQVYRFNPETKQLEFDRSKCIYPSQRKEYIFLVCLIKWKDIYPLGAVIEVQDPDYDEETSLSMICLANKVSVFYKEETVKKVQEILEQDSDDNKESWREDFSHLNVFTIDKKGSKDLDDALSIKEISDSKFEVGVHIADVSSIVKKDDDVDLEAQLRSTTFNPGGKSCTYHMLPEPLATGQCSLLPDKRRKTLSVFFTVDRLGNISNDKSEIKRTFVKSRRSFTYQQVQKILSGEGNDEDLEYRDHLLLMSKISKKIRFKRLGNRVFSFPFEAKYNESCDAYYKSLEAQYIVEEFMILANQFIAQILLERYPDCVPLRIQGKPSSSQMKDWVERHPVFFNFVLSLQNQSLPKNQTLSIDSVHEENFSHQIPVQKYIWKKMIWEFNMGRSKNVGRYIGTDEFHPQQAIAYESWIAFQKTSIYQCSGVPHKEMHFSLGIYPYVRFTSPIRRYADLIVHRLVHAKLNKTTSPYSQGEVDELCRKLNERRSLAFERQCRLFYLGRKLHKRPRFFHGLSISASAKALQVCFPGIRVLSKSCNEIEFRHLKVKTKPEFTGCRKADQLLTLTWQQRLYSLKGQSSEISEPSCSPVKLNPHQKIHFFSVGKWKAVINAMINDNLHALKEDIDESEILEVVPECHETYHDASSEKQNGIIIDQCTKFSLSFNRGQVVPVQLGADLKGGKLLPAIHLLEITNNVKLCLQHMSDPVQHFAAYATSHAGNRMMLVSEYMQRWFNIFRMESATNACRSMPIVLNDLPITFRTSTQSHGYFVLQKKFCEDRDLDLRWEKSNTGCRTIPFERNFLCIRCEIVKGTPSRASTDCSPNNRYIWVGHGETKFIQKEDSEAKVYFLLHNKSRRPTQSMKCASNTLCTVEILQMSASERRVEQNLVNLEKATDLARSIALRQKIPDLDDPHLKLQSIVNLNEFGSVLPQNNEKQTKAIRKALSARFTLIHGPPGTGKTLTGIKLVLLFVDINKKFRENGGDHKQVVYCGPSNKSVDLVARWLHLNLGDLCPCMVRMYGSSIENTVYPIPGRDYIYQSSSKYNRPDPDLEDVSLHNVIREKNKPFAEELERFDKLFENNPKEVTPEDINEYNKLLSKATQRELKLYDVIFCTTAVATNPKFLKATKGKVFQLIIDEAGMCTEPGTIAPIIATEAEQVVLIGDHVQLQPIVICREAGRLGLSRSLFERYADNSLFLESQHRMNPHICAFPSKQFYKEKLRTEISTKWEVDKPLSIWNKRDIPLMFCHVEGEEEFLTVATEEGNEQSCSNRAEVEHVVKLYGFLTRKERLKPSQVKIMSQYKAQKFAIQEALTQKKFKNVEVNTVVGSQGGEWDYVIFSTVRSLPAYRIEPFPTLGWCSQNLGFITDQHQINVALTRARKGIIIIGNQNLLKCDAVWNELLKHYRRLGCVVNASDQDLS